ncbi:MAG: hypothetical protein ABIR70_20075 [Bryobacteraceae bacterium]
MTIRWMLVAVLLLAGCKRQAPEAEVKKEQAADLVSAFGMADAPAAQMTHGFHGLENGWRWVASKFGVTLSPPDLAGKAAQLELKFALPSAVFDRMGAVTLSATVNGKPLPSQKYSSAGNQVYSQELAAGTFGPGPVTVEFSTDKALPPGNGDARELALIVTHVGLTVK